VYHQLKEGSGNILAFKIAGGMTKKPKEQICKVLEKQIRESGKIRLLLVIESQKIMDAESLLFDLDFTLTYTDKIERMAIIGNKVWEKTWSALFGLFSHIQTQYFDRSQIKAAWKWIHN
jgi:SpoIIAA-like